MSYRVRGLSAEPFLHLYGLCDHALAAHGARRYLADAKPGYPDRIEVRDAEPGETLLLVNYMHQPAATPYRASHAIFVREGALAACDCVDAIPEAMRVRPISLRAFDAAHLMTDAELVDGRDLEASIERMLADRQTNYLHAHYAVRGCYAARIEHA